MRTSCQNHEKSMFDSEAIFSKSHTSFIKSDFYQYAHFIKIKENALNKFNIVTFEDGKCCIVL